MTDVGIGVDRGSQRQARRTADWQQTEAAEKLNRPYHLNGRRLHRHHHSYDGDDIEIGRHADEDSNVSSSSSSRLNSSTIAGGAQRKMLLLDYCD